MWLSGPLSPIDRRILGHLKIIGLKALGDYSNQFWSNKFSILLLETPKPNMFMISVFLGPWKALFMDLNIPKYF